MISARELRQRLEDEALPALRKALESRHANPDAVSDAEAEVDRIIEQIDEAEFYDRKNRAAAARTPVKDPNAESIW